MTPVVIIATWIILSVIGALVIARFLSLSEPCDDAEGGEESLREDDLHSLIHVGT